MKPLHRYRVTVTPKIVTYAGSDTYGEYTVEVDAYDRADAIKSVRRERNDNEGRYGVPATYRASRITE
jgi:hypothetical protein